MGLTLRERKALVEGARSAIRDFLETGAMDEPPVYIPESLPGLREARGVFVSLHKAGELRGCMGMPVSLLPLGQACRVSARNAACKDPRFPPLDAGEHAQVRLEITVMGTPREFVDASQIRAGGCGIMLQKGFRWEVFLPALVAGLPGDRGEIMAFLREMAAIDDGEDAPETWSVFDVEVITEDGL